MGSQAKSGAVCILHQRIPYCRALQKPLQSSLIQNSKAKYPFLSCAQTESFGVPPALGTRLGFLAPAVETDCRLQAARRRVKPSVRPGNKEGITGIDGVCREGLWQNKVESRGLARPCRAFHIRAPGQTAGLPRSVVLMAVPAQRKETCLAGCLCPLGSPILRSGVDEL